MINVRQFPDLKPLCAAISPSLAGAILLTGFSQAHAQLEEVIVTAQKRQESMQEVPVAVTAISSDAIARQNIVNIEDLNNSLPNVQINHFANSPDSAVFTIRGVGVNDADPYVGTTVSVVVDGVVVGVNTAALVSLFDIERIEILRGPQGTLFGANTTGGVVNVVTKQPTGEFGGKAQLTVGNYDSIDANLAVDFPITDSLAGKISVLHTENEGYFKNYLNGDKLGSVDITSLRGYLKYERDTYDATFIGEYVESHNGSQVNRNISDDTQILYVPGQTGIQPSFRRGKNANVPDQNDKDTYSATLNQHWGSDFGDWVSITNYMNYDHDLFSDDDATTEQLLQTHRWTDYWQFSQEIRNSFDISDRFRMTAGAFYLKKEYKLEQDGVLDGFARGLGQPQKQNQENWSVALFAQGYYDLSDKLTLQAGLRYAHEETKAFSLNSNTFTTEPGGLASWNDPLIPGSVVTAEGDESWDDVGYKIGLDYQISDATMVYGYYARGFKSGGFTGRIFVADDIGPFDPEYLDTVEVGFKSDLLENRLRANMAVFYNEYEDMQVVQNLTYPSGANSASVQNAGQANSYGAELELTGYATDNLVFNLALAYLESEYDEYDTVSLDPVTGDEVVVSFAGNPLMNAPEWSGNVSATYTVPIVTGETEFFVQYTYSDDKISNYTAFPQEHVDEIKLLNAKVTWQSENYNWSVGVYGRNLTDEEYYLQKMWFSPSFGIGGMGAPREYGVDVTYNW